MKARVIIPLAIWTALRAVPAWKGRKTMAQCPECEAQVSVQDLLIGEVLYCPDCSAELEVLNVEQPQVGLAPRVEEDWGE